jgi:hypothetical protein
MKTPLLQTLRNLLDAGTQPIDGPQAFSIAASSSPIQNVLVTHYEASYNNQKYIVYHMEVTTADGTQFHAKKRYSDFRAFYDQLQSNGKCQRAPFPPKVLHR